MNDFMKIYEKLSDLYESKADIEKLRKFSPGSSSTFFLKLRKDLKPPENDIYYWIKNKTPEEFSDFVFGLVKAREEKAANEGAKLVAENDYWSVYNITSIEASKKYGRDTRWCVAGNNGSASYFDIYTDTYGASLYFFITKGTYDARGTDSKYAISYYNQGFYEIWDQQDKPVTHIPNAPRIPGITEDFTIPIPFDAFLYKGGSIGNSKVYRKYLTKVVVQEGISELPYRAFISCENLEECFIPDSVVSIADNAFYNCPKLTIICSKGSYAEQFARDNNIACSLI